MEKLNIFNYINYRKFLKDFYDFQKKNNSFFSYRYFSSKAGFSSPNFLKLVIEGKRNISQKSILQFAKVLKLTNKETNYFENLVLMEQSKNSETKEYYYEKILKSQNLIDKQKLSKEQYKYFSKWYYPIIRELIIFCDDNNPIEKIYKKLFPSISLKEFKTAIKFLEQLKLIKKIKKNKWIQNDDILFTGEEVESIFIFNYHKKMLDLAKNALDEFSWDERDISSMILAIPQNFKKEYKKLLEEFQNNIFKLADKNKEKEEIIYLSFQMFPLTKKLKQ